MADRIYKYGNNILLFIDTTTAITETSGVDAEYQFMVCLTSNGFSMTHEAITTTNKCTVSADGSGWASSIAGVGSWTMDFSGQATVIQTAEIGTQISHGTLVLLAKSGAKFWAKWGDVEATIVREGVAYITDWSETANINEPITFSGTLTGSGEPTLLTTTPS